MNILSVDQVRAADAYTIEHEPIKSIDLMERASAVFADWYRSKFAVERPVAIFCGMGNNGGDGLAVARMLAQNDYLVSVYIVRYASIGSPDLLVNEERLKAESAAQVIEIMGEADLRGLPDDTVVIDALWGSGLSRPIEGFAAHIIERLNEGPYTRVALDMPSGLYADSFSDSVKFKAHYTLTFEVPKLSFLFAESYPYVGEWEARSIGLHPDFLDAQDSPNIYLDKELVKGLIKKRSKFAHKGTYGHALLVTGSYGKMGAAVLAARACLRSGAGLLSLHIPSCGYDILQTDVPEAMVFTDKQHDHISDVQNLAGFSAMGIGPGLGQDAETAEVLKQLLEQAAAPMVLDADALNMIAANKWQNLLPENCILTPHPKEFERLFGETKNAFEKLELLRNKAQELKVYIVLKGAHTAIACPDGRVFFNSTGNPGMATGGTGDVLTGLITGLLTQAYRTRDAAIIGVYLHGLAADVCAQAQGLPSITAGDVIDGLGKAWQLME